MVALLLSFLFGAHVAYADIVEDDVISWWACEEESGVRYDSAASGNDLTDNNTVGFDDGVVGNACSFVRAQSEYLTISDGSQTGLDIAGDHSMGAWVYLASDDAVQVMGRFDGQQGPSGRAYTLYKDGNTSTSLDANFSNGTSDQWKYVTWAPSLTTWYHLFYTYDNAGTVCFYVDGSLVGSCQSTTITSINNNSVEFAVGVNGYYHTAYMNGRLDELAVFNRTLTADEVSALYNEGVGVTYDDLFTEESTTTATTTTTELSTDDIIYTIALAFSILFGLIFTYIGYKFFRIFI